MDDSPLNMTPKSIRRLIESQDYKCALTGADLSPQNATLDHMIPLSRGGAHSICNAQIILDWVNKAKGTMTHMEFIEMCRSVVLVHGA